MPPFLAKRVAGLPTWAWLAILVGGATIGLILRSRQTDDEQLDEDVADEGELDEYPEVYAADETYPAEGFGPNAIDTLGTGGYVNYPIQPIQPGINVNVGSGGAPCDEKNRPKAKAIKGYQWGCRNGVWIQIPLGGPKPKPQRGGKCGPRPRGKPRHGHWECRNGRWVATGGGRGRGNDGGGGRGRKVRTGGGPPASRDVHTPLRGLPKGRSSEAVATWVPGNPSLIVPTR
jgi:hypothetical protein